MKMVYIAAAILAVSPILAIAFFKGAGLGDDDMAQKMGSEKEEAPKSDKKPQAEAAKEIHKRKESEPGVEEMQENFNADHRTDTGVAVNATQPAFDEHHSLDEGVDVNAPRVDPGHIRNAVMEENGYVPAQDVDKEDEDDSEVTPTFKSDKHQEDDEEELDAEAVKKENKK